jgi:cytochrome b subunit of formate dehydrogenase
VRLVISNDRATTARPEIRITEIKLFSLGQTPYLWTRYPRLLVRGLQKNLFQTKILLPLVILGLGLLLWARRGRALIFLLTVPAYYLLIHAALSTEYRYILAIHYFFFILAAITLCGAGLAVKQGAQYFLNQFRSSRKN